MVEKKILIIAFKFSPYPEVGAYRWTKFSRCFADKGYRVHIITVKWENIKNQSWHKDIIHSNIFIHQIPSLCFHNFKYYKFSRNIFGWILNKLRNQILKLSYFFYYIDEAQYWGKKLIPFAKNLINKEKIKYVIATGGPFMSNYWASVLKNKLPWIKLIQDFRDEWNENRNFILKYYRKRSYDYEKYALNNCDVVVTTSIGLNTLFKKNIQNNKVKQYIIYNGYDDQKIQNININNKSEIKRDFSFIYAGSLSNQRDLILDILLRIINKNIKKFNEIKINIYTSDIKGINNKYQELIKNKNLMINPFVPQNDLFMLIKNSFCALHFMPESQSFIVSIKLFEYGILRRPILSINAGGDSEYLIKKHNLGYTIKYNDEKKILDTLIELYQIWQKNPFYKLKPVGLEKYSYKNLSEEYLNIINSL